MNTVTKSLDIEWDPDEFLRANAPEREQPDDITTAKAMAAGWGARHAVSRRMEPLVKAGQFRRIDGILANGRPGVFWRRVNG